MSTAASNDARADEPVPCPSCRESISGQAIVCPHCRKSTLVDVMVERAVADPKLKYRAARAVAAIVPGAPLASVQAGASVSGGRVLAGVTPGVAAACAAALQDLGIATRQVPASPEVEAPSGGNVVKYVAAAVVAGALGGIALWAVKGRSAAPARTVVEEEAAGPRLSGAELAARGLQSTVLIRCLDSLGSGFFVAEDRILTNAHVVCPEGETVVVRNADGDEGTGTVLSADDGMDLALVRVEGIKGRPARLGDAGVLRVGDRVAVVGAPKGMDFSVTQGSVSNMARLMLGVSYLQTDAAINPGNSGGPMLDEHGRVVGVVTMKRTDAEGIALVLPINYAFTGARPLITPPDGRTSPGFDKLAQAAEAADREEVSKLAQSGQRPGLMMAEVAGPRIKVGILWPTTFDPGQQSFSFTLYKGREHLCTVQGNTSAWRKLEGEDGRSLIPPAVKAWLERNGFSSNLWAAGVLLDYTTCHLAGLQPSDKVYLELEGADPDAARLEL